MNYIDAFERGLTASHAIICMDIDGVLAFFMEAAITALNVQFGTSYLPANESYYFQSWLPKEQGEWIDKLFADPNFYRGIAPDYSGVAACAALSRCGEEIWVVTDRPEAATTVTTEWLDHWRISRSVTIVGKGMKAAVAEHATEGLIFIDDDPRKIEDLPLDDPSKDIQLFLIRRPWTPTNIENPHVYVFDKWVDLLLYLDVVPELCDVPQLWRTPTAEDTSSYR